MEADSAPCIKCINRAVENLIIFINRGVSSSNSVTSSVSQNIGVFKEAIVENNTAGARWTKCLDLGDRRNIS